MTGGRTGQELSGQVRADVGDDARSALVNLVVVLADNKYWLGRHLSEWAVGALSLEVSVACAAIAQGELGQARVLHPLLEELPFPAAADPARRARSYHLSLLDQPFPTWPHAVAALFLVDTATTVMLETLAGGPWEPLTRRVPRMLEEEAFHFDFAVGRIRELADLPGGRELLSDRVDESLEELLCWFGPPGEPGVEALRGAGLLNRGNQELRQSYLDQIIPVLRDAGIEPRPRGATLASGGARSSDHGLDHGNLPWDRWNQLQRRLEPTA